ncbi:hypothetical protein M5K25_001773 [Dendrobium thyrsiflorum]|uniref:Uncharacterized protein n=1 Tax=Dendrobium thyrsiflorum TaxID=117978 RepID=A0ABD0VSN1_DENTH
MVLMTSFADYGPSDLRHPPTTIFPTSVARRLRSLRPPLLTTIFRPLSPNNGLSNLRRPSATVLTTSFADNGPSDLRRQTMACYKQWSDLKGTVEKEVQRKKLVLNLLTKNVKEIKTGDTIIMTGLVVPPTLVMLKKSSQNVPQLKRFRLDLVPNVVFGFIWDGFLIAS